MESVWFFLVSPVCLQDFKWNEKNGMIDICNFFDQNKWLNSNYKGKNKEKNNPLCCNKKLHEIQTCWHLQNRSILPFKMIQYCKKKKRIRKSTSDASKPIKTLLSLTIVSGFDCNLIVISIFWELYFWAKILKWQFLKKIPCVYYIFHHFL